MTTILIGILEEGLVYTIMALGVCITYKILDFPDLSVDGTFPVGAVLAASAVIAEVSLVLTPILAFAAGALADYVTGLIHVKFKVRDLLSGIVIMTALRSINLRIVGRWADVPLFPQETIFENAFLEKLVLEALAPYTVLVILLVIVIICKILLDLYLETRSEYLLRAMGDNDVLVISLAKDKGMVKIAGLAVANSFTALTGAVYCQQKGFFEISMGTGTIVIGLANVIIGTQLFKKIGFVKSTTAVIIGSIVYKACVSFAISCDVEANDLKLVATVLSLIILVLSNDGRKKVKVHA